MYTYITYIYTYYKYNYINYIYIHYAILYVLFYRQVAHPGNHHPAEALAERLERESKAALSVSRPGVDLDQGFWGRFLGRLWLKNRVTPKWVALLNRQVD